MTGDESQFITLEAKNRGMVIFRDNGKRKIIGIDNIGITPSIFIGHRYGNVYMVDLENLSLQNMQCLVAMNAKINETSWLWYCKLAHINMHTLSKIIKKDLIFDL